MKRNGSNPATASAHSDTSRSQSRLAALLTRLFNRETILYGVFGVLTTLLNLGLFRLLLLLQLDYKLANIMTLLVVKLTAYVVNKAFVFQSHSASFSALCKEFLRYLVTRGFTMLIDYFGLILLVSLFGASEMVGKCIVTAVVVILNYILGKRIVFVKKNHDREKELHAMETVQPEGNYYNKYQSKNPIEQRLVDGYFSALHAMLAPLAPVASVFDAGCGEGLVTRRIRDLLAPASMKASDISAHLIEDNLVQPENSGISFFTSSIYDTGLASGSCELVCACEVIEHLEQPERALAELFRVSSRYVFISVPNEPIWRMANLLRGKYLREWGNTPGHVRHFSLRTLCRAIESAAGSNTILVSKRSPFPWIQVLYEKKMQ